MMRRLTDDGCGPGHGRAALAAGLLVPLLLLVAACGGGPVASSPSGSAEAALSGGSLTLAYEDEPATLDPARATTPLELGVDHAVYQGLLRYAAAPGAAGTVLQPCLATAVPSVANGGVSPDGLTYRFTLRDGVLFQPPVTRAVTAADCKYSFERLLKTATASTRRPFMGVAGAPAFVAGRANTVSGYAVDGSSTVRITLTRPDPALLQALATQAGDVVPREWVDKWGADLGRHPLGCGPFAFVEWKAGEQIQLARNPSYWEPDHPSLDAVVYQLAVAPPDAVRMLRAGEVDALGDDLPPATLRQVAADPDDAALLASQPLLAGSYLAMDVRREPFDDVGVRRAVSWAIDRERLTALQGGSAVALQQLYPPNLPGGGAGRPIYGYRPARARALLAAAGFRRGLHATLQVAAVPPGPRVARALRADLAAVGIHVRIVKVAAASPASTGGGTTGAGGPPLRVIGWDAAAVADPSVWVGPLATRAGIAGGSNASFWWSPALERRFAHAQSTNDGATRLNEFAKMEWQMGRAAPYAALFSPLQTTMHSRTTGGFYLHPVYGLDPASYWKQ